MGNYNKNKKYHFIYKITNLVNGKYYKGMHSTNNLDDGYKGSGSAILKSFKKYGKKNHKIEILEFCENREQLEKREREIVNLDEVKNPNSYNLAVGGNGGYFQWTDEQKKKISDALKGRKISKEVRENMSRGQKGRIHTEETRMKIGNANRGNKNGMYGKVVSEKTRKKLSEANKGHTRKHNEITKKKISESLKGHSISEETRKKLSLAAKKQWQRQRVAD